MIVDGGGLWCRIELAALTGCPALFLDRDGVIIADTHYVGQAGEMRMLEGAAPAIARCNALKIPVVVVTNQSGIARGYYDWDGFRAVQAALSGALAAAGAHLDAVLACAYHADGRGRLRVADHPWRKPAPGMILEAARRTGIDLARSWIIGDRVHDLAAGSAAGLAGGTLVGPGDRDGLNAGSLASDRFVVATASSLADAVAALMGQGRFGHPA